MSKPAPFVLSHVHMVALGGAEAASRFVRESMDFIKASNIPTSKWNEVLYDLIDIEIDGNQQRAQEAWLEAFATGNAGL